METTKYELEPLVESVLHATDFSQTSMNAFAHALATAMNRRTSLILLHAGSGKNASREWSRMPGVRDMLERWGYLEKGSPRSAVFEKLAMEVTKVYMKVGNARSAMLDFLSENPVDLLVLATEGRQGLPRLFRGSIAEKVARTTRTMTLFVPSGARGFVSMDTGEITLKKILIPVDLKPDPYPAITYAIRAAVFSGEELIEMHLLHVGPEATMPVIQTGDRDYLSWKTMSREGDPVVEILGAASEIGADLIVMATAGHQGVLDALRGSVTEQVVRGAQCPVLAVPIPA